MLNCRHPGLCAWMGGVRLGMLDTISGDSPGLRRSAPACPGLPRSAPDEFQKSRFDRQAADLSLLDHHGRDVLSDRTDVLSQQQTSVLSQQQTSVLSQQKTSILSQQRTSRLALPALELAEFWPGTRGILGNYMVSGLPCGSSPTTRSGQDDGSTTNSLKSRG